MMLCMKKCCAGVCVLWVLAMLLVLVQMHVQCDVMHAEDREAESASRKWNDATQQVGCSSMLAQEGLWKDQRACRSGKLAASPGEAKGPCPFGASEKRRNSQGREEGGNACL